MTPDGMVDIEVEITDEQAGHLVLAGMFKLAQDGVLEITPKGSAWLHEWCDERIAEHGGERA